MKIVLDTNILISALLKDSSTRKLVFEHSPLLYIPSYVLDEVREHENEIAKKSKLSVKEIHFLIKKLIKNSEVIPRENVMPFREKAKEIIQKIDPDDVLIIASALFLQESVIWSEDKALKKQHSVPVYNTQEIIDLLFTI